MNFQDCLEKGLIKRSEFNTEIIKKELDIADKFFVKAKKFKDLKEYEASAMFCYIAMFHYARALLYSNGFKERSHFCVFQYLIDNYKDKLKELGETCQKYRHIREVIQYEGSDSDEELVNNMLSDTEILKSEIKKKLSLYFNLL